MLLLFRLFIPKIVLVQEINSSVCRTVWRRRPTVTGYRSTRAPKTRRPPDKSRWGSAWWGFTWGMRECWEINRTTVNGLVVGGRRRRHRRGRGADLVSLLKKGVKVSFLASGSLFFSFFNFLSNLSAPLLSDGFTGEGWGGRGQENMHRLRNLLFKQTFFSLPLFTMAWRAFPLFFFFFNKALAVEEKQK